MGWEKFTDAVLRIVEENASPRPLYLLWGGKAKKKRKTALAKVYDERIVEAPHPVAWGDAFVRSEPFHRADAAFLQIADQPFDWSLSDACR